MARELVTKENSLVAASYSLDLIEQRLILLSIALSRRTGLGLSAQKPLFITAQEFFFCLWLRCQECISAT